MGEGKDSISVEKLNISDTYTVGINLEKAISNPGSDFDLVLREGDVLFIPEYINTVKISGAVMYCISVVKVYVITSIRQVVMVIWPRRKKLM